MIIVKHYKGQSTADYFMSDMLSVGTTSYIVKELQPNQNYTYQLIAREEKGILGIDYNRSPKTTFITRKSNAVVEIEAPLPTTHVLDDQAQVMIAGLGIEIFMGIVIGSLVVSIIVIGVIYNCVRKKEAEKDLELDSSFDEDEDDEDSEEDDASEDEVGDEAPDTKKYDMMISDTNRNIKPVSD